jgi:HEAT repeat protein
MEPPSPPAELTDVDHRVRLRAIYALVESRHPVAGQWIRPLLCDREAPVRSAAIVALGQLRDQDAFDALVACLAAPTSHERRNAVQALVALGDPRMREPLVYALKTEPWAPVRGDIIKALSTFRDDAIAIDALIEALTDRDEDVRATAAVALAKMGASKALPALQHMALTDTNQETIIHGLWELNSTVALRAIEMIRAPERATPLDWPD